MKKSYLLILGLSFSAITFAQKKIVDRSPNETGLSVDNSVRTIKKGTTVTTKTEGDIFGADDFASMGTWTTSGPDGTVWMYDTDGPDGQYSSTTNADIITSTTAANGFMIFDADLSNTPGNPATFVDRQGSLVSRVFDLTGQTSLNIRFQHAYRTCCSASFTPLLEVSVDGFATFQSYDVTATGIGVNDFSETVLEEVNIGDFLVANVANLNNFQCRFNFDGVAGATSHYFWQVDDFEFFTPYSYSLVTRLEYWGTTGFWEERMPYSMIPSTQVAPIDFSILVENTGVVTQNDVVLTTTIPEGSFTNVGTPSIINFAETDTLNMTVSFTPTTTLTTYNPSFAVTSGNVDAFPADNDLVGVPFEVTDGFYARDMRVIDGSQSNTGLAYEAGNIFDIFTDAVTSSGSMYISSTTNVGSVVYLRLYTIDPATGDFVYADESLPYTITTADLSTMLTLNLQNPVNLLANNSYLLVGGTLGDGGATNDLRIGTSGTSAAQTSFFLDEAGTWFYTTSTPMVRMFLGTPAPTPVVTSTDTDNILCTGGSLTLTSDIVGGNVWSDGTTQVGTTDAITVTTAGTYTVTNDGMTSAPITVTIQAINTTITVSGGALSVPTQNGAAYQWGTCSPVATIPGATLNTFTAPANADYSVAVTINGCSAISIPCATVSGVGLNENEAFSSFSVYPNPADENIAIDFSLRAESAVNVSITDLSGKVVYTSNLGNKTAGASSLNVNTAAFANGIYVVNVLTNNGIATEKLVIRK